MALLNYSPLITSTIDGSTSKPVDWIGLQASDSDYLKLVFTGDKHIITHGVDLLSDFKNKIRGLVPSLTGADQGILTEEGWKTVLTANYLPIRTNFAKNEGEGDTSYANSLSSSITTMDVIKSYVDTQINNSFAANDAMRYKGGVSSSDELAAKVPYYVGDTYRALAGFEFNGQLVQAGDLLISTSDSIDYNYKHWTVVQTNINGTKKVIINGDDYSFYTDAIDNSGSSDLKFFAPTTLGTSGQLSYYDGDKISWLDPSGLKVGSASSADVAAKVANTLIIGNGLFGMQDQTKVSTYDGFKPVTLHLAPATENELGGVKVDVTYLTLNNGTLSIDAEKFAEALGKVESITPTIKLETYLEGNFKGISIKVGNTEDNKVTFIESRGITFNTSGNTTTISGRDIQIGGNSIGNQTLNFIPTGNVAVVTNNKNLETTDVYDVGFDLFWFNLATGKYET